MTQEKIVLVDGARTPIGSFGGMFKDVPGFELGATAATAALERSGVSPESIESAAAKRWPRSFAGSNDMEQVRYRTQDAVAEIRLNRAEVSNSIDLATAHALSAAVRRAAADGDVRAVLVSGNGARFCAGGDL